MERGFQSAFDKSPRDTLGGPRLDKQMLFFYPLLFCNIEISLLTQLTWKVDSGDGRLAGSWRPLVGCSMKVCQDGEVVSHTSQAGEDLGKRRHNQVIAVLLAGK